MLNKTIKACVTVLLLNGLPVSANASSAINADSNFSAIESSIVGSQAAKDPFPLKNSKTYDEANDPAFKRCGTNSEGPQHGYFAVPLLVLGLAGVLLYFSKHE